MAAYGSGYYGGGNYSYGVQLGALNVSDTSTVTVVGQSLKNAQAAISSSSTVSIGAIKIANAGFAIDGTSVITVAGGISAVGNVDIVATSVLNIEYNRIQHFAGSIIESSSVVINARKKWETEADVSETWTPIEDVSESWTTVLV